jgi:DNA-binding IclR family transcriptional regulator
MKFKYSKETKTFKLQQAMQQGQAFTQSKATKQFGIKNLSAEVDRIRKNGYAVYSNSRKAGNGVVVREYHLGEASRELVALAYHAKAIGLSV